MYKIMALFILMIFSSQVWTQTLEEENREQVEKNINSAEEMIFSLEGDEGDEGDFKIIRKRFLNMQKAISILDSIEILRSTIVAKLKEPMTALDEKLENMNKTIGDLENELENTRHIIRFCSGPQADDYKDKISELAIKRTNLADLHDYYRIGYEKMEKDILKLEKKCGWYNDMILDVIDFLDNSLN